MEPIAQPRFEAVRVAEVSNQPHVLQAGARILADDMVADGNAERPGAGAGHLDAGLPR